MLKMYNTQKNSADLFLDFHNKMKFSHVKPFYHCLLQYALFYSLL